MGPGMSPLGKAQPVTSTGSAKPAEKASHPAPAAKEDDSDNPFVSTKSSPAAASAAAGKPTVATALGHAFLKALGTSSSGGKKAGK